MRPFVDAGAERAAGRRAQVPDGLRQGAGCRAARSTAISSATTCSSSATACRASSTSASPRRISSPTISRSPSTTGASPRRTQRRARARARRGARRRVRRRAAADARTSARSGRRCCAPPRCASGCRGSTTSTCRAPASSCTRTTRRTSSASCAHRDRATACASAGAAAAMPLELEPRAMSAAPTDDRFRALLGAPRRHLAARTPRRCCARRACRGSCCSCVYYLIQSLVSVVPLAGPLAMMVLRPVFTVGFLAAAWTQERGGMPELRHLFRGFGSNLWALLPIGIVLLVGTTGRGAVDAPSSTAARCSMRSRRTEAADEALAANSRVESRDAARRSCRAADVARVWFAPALIVFQDCGPRSALATSLAPRSPTGGPRGVRLLLFFFGAVLPGIGDRAHRARCCRRPRAAMWSR